jgi:hypothetical protein
MALRHGHVLMAHVHVLAAQHASRNLTLASMRLCIDAVGAFFNGESRELFTVHDRPCERH